MSIGQLLLIQFFSRVHVLVNKHTVNESDNVIRMANISRGNIEVDIQEGAIEYGYPSGIFIFTFLQ
jgi:hypothetical protein